MKALPTPPAPVVGNCQFVVFHSFSVSITDNSNENLFGSGHCCSCTEKLLTKLVKE